MAQSEEPSKEVAAVEVVAPTISAWLETYVRERLANVRKRLPEAARELGAAGVRCVQIHYDGCGDSGQIESIDYTDQEGKPVDPRATVTLTEDQLMDVFYDLTQARHPGWENNEGAFGEFTWDLVEDTLNHTHNDRYEHYDTTEHEGL